jgi:mono/diheme cytochrome c family protein
MWQVLGAIAVLSAGAQTSPAPTDAGDSASRGLYVALRVCSACHKVAFPGVGPDLAAPSFASIHARYDPDGLRRMLADISRTGHRMMPPIPLSSREIEDVAAYIATVPPESSAAIPRRDGRRHGTAVRRVPTSLIHAAQ